MMNGESSLPKITHPDIMEARNVIYDSPDNKSPVLMKDCVNFEHEDSTRKNPVEKNDTKVNY